MSDGRLHVVGFCSPIFRCGKDTAALAVTGSAYGFRRVALADAVRRFVAGRHGFPVERFDEAKAQGGLAAFFARLLLVHVGTDQMRAQDEDAWIDKFYAHLGRNPGIRRVAVTDVRFPNEARGVIDIGGCMIGVRRRVVEAVERSTHASESHYATIAAMAQRVGRWAEVHNDGTVEELHEAVRAAFLPWAMSREIGPV